MREQADAIISVHRAYAEALLAGTKTVELRRRFPELPAGTRLWIYITQPTGAIAGHVTLGGISRASPISIWRKHGIYSGIDKETFSEYFKGTDDAVAIQIESAERTSSIPLEKLRQMRANFHPPQIVTKLTVAESAALRKLSKSSSKQR